jgi:hypothetical protein
VIPAPTERQTTQRDMCKPFLSILARACPLSQPGLPHPEVLVAVLAQLHVGVTAERLQEATRHSAEKWTRTRNTGTSRRRRRERIRVAAAVESGSSRANPGAAVSSSRSAGADRSVVGRGRQKARAACLGFRALGGGWFCGGCWPPCCTARSSWSVCPSRGLSGVLRNSPLSHCYKHSCVARTRPAACEPSRPGPRAPWATVSRDSETPSRKNYAAAYETARGRHQVPRRARAQTLKLGLGRAGPRSPNALQCSTPTLPLRSHPGRCARLQTMTKIVGLQTSRSQELRPNRHRC